jgi:hypothetical protein
LLSLQLDYDLIYLISGLLLAAAAGRLPGALRQPRNPVPWLVFGMLVLFALCFLLGTPLAAPVLALLRYPSIADVLQHDLFVATSVLVQLLLARRGRTATRRRIALAAAVVLAQTALFFTAPVGWDEVDFVARYGTDPRIAAYTVLFTAFQAVVLADAGLAVREHRRAARDPLVRLGLTLLGLSAVAGLAYVLHKIVYAVPLAFGVHPGWAEGPVNTLLAGPSTVLFLLGLTIANWHRWALAPVRWARRCRDYRRIRPLWLAVRTALPSVALSVPPAGIPLRHLAFWLYRTVVEVNDALLILRPRFDARVPDLVAAHAPAGLTGRRLDAVTSAALLAVVLRNDPAPRSDAPWPVAPAAPGAGPAEQAEFLGQVAQAYRHSPVVAAVLGAAAEPAERVAS